MISTHPRQFTCDHVNLHTPLPLVNWWHGSTSVLSTNTPNRTTYGGTGILDGRCRCSDYRTYVPFLDSGRAHRIASLPARDSRVEAT